MFYNPRHSSARTVQGIMIGWIVCAIKHNPEYPHHKVSWPVRPFSGCFRVTRKTGDSISVLLRLMHQIARRSDVDFWPDLDNGASAAEPHSLYHYVSACYLWYPRLRVSRLWLSTLQGCSELFWVMLCYTFCYILKITWHSLEYAQANCLFLILYDIWIPWFFFPHF